MYLCGLRPISCATLPILLLVAQPALAFLPQLEASLECTSPHATAPLFRWELDDLDGKAIPIYLNSAGTADIQSVPRIEAAVRRALETWSSVSTSTLRVTYAGLTSAGYACDGKNTVVFDSTGALFPADRKDLATGCSKVIAFAHTYAPSECPQREVDIILNDFCFPPFIIGGGYPVRWNTAGRKAGLRQLRGIYAADVQRLLTHELGHLVGLCQSGKPTPQ